MNKAELIDGVVKGVKAKDVVSKAQAERMVSKVFDVIKEAVANGDSVSIAGFGTFRPVERAERTARNPQTGEPVHVPAHKVPAFKAASGFKDLVAE